MHDVAVFNHTTKSLTRLPGPWAKPHKVVRVILPTQGAYCYLRLAYPAARDRASEYLVPLPGNTDPLPYLAQYRYLWHGFSITAETSRLKVYDTATGRLRYTHRL